jgi:hypothetical protein
MTTPENRDEPRTPDADRRSFLLAAAGAATVVAVGGAAHAEQPGAAGKPKLAGTVAARFDPKRKPSLEEVHAAVNRILDLHGCSKCGLLGIDLRLFLGDPPERVQGIQGVDVSVQRHVEVG